MEWTECHDVELAREVLVLEPYRQKPRTAERGKVWQEIADNLNSHKTLKFKVTQKSVREHMKLLLDKHRAKKNSERRASGIEVEDSELDKALEEISEKWEAAEEQDIMFLKDKKKAEHDRSMGEEMRRQACEKLGQTSKRKAEENDDAVGEPKKKKSRKGGSETIDFLREKAKMEMEFKQEEQRAKREEQERQTTFYEMQLANQQQQQQQQQHNEVMSLMLGLVKKMTEK